MLDDNLRELARVLSDIQAHIIRHASFARASGTLPDDSGHATDNRDIEHMRARLARVTRALKAQESQLNMRDMVARRAPKEHRRRARQAAKHDHRTLADVYKIAADVLRDLEMLAARNATVSLAELTSAVAQQHADATEKAQQASDFVYMIGEHRAHFESLHNPAPTVQNVPLNFMLVLVIAYLGIKAQVDRFKL